MVGPPQIISRSTWRSPVGHGGPPPGQWGTREGDVAGWPIVLGPHLSCAHPPPAWRTPSWRPTALRHQLYIPDTVRVRTCKTGEEKHAEKVKKLRDPHPRARRYLQIYFLARHAVTLRPPRHPGPTCHRERSQQSPGGDRRVQWCRCRRRARRPESEQCAHVGSDFWRRTPLDRAVSRICRSLCETQMGA
jgi:hypothetical protein